MQRLAIIDAGTNTFHLQVVERTTDSLFRNVRQQRFYVSLAEEGLEQIGPNAYNRALQAFRGFRSTLDEWEIGEVFAFGTAGLRSAGNGADLLQQIESETAIPVRIIDGDEEARLIHLGVSQAGALKEDLSLIMDVGGGSVEFILADAEQCHWAKSFPLGVGLLYNQFDIQEPLQNREIQRMRAHIEEVARPLLQELERHRPKALIGTSGAFDVLRIMGSVRSIGPKLYEAQTQAFPKIYERLIHTTLEERLKMPRMPKNRTKLMLTGLLLIDFLLRNCPAQRMLICDYGLREGIISDLFYEKS